MKRAVLFDMDGVLADTEFISIEVARGVCKEFGIELDEWDVRSYSGRSDKDFYESLRAKYEIPHETVELVRRQCVHYDAVLAARAVPFAAARELPWELKKQGFALGLVSGSTRAQVDIVLTLLGLGDCFDSIVSADEVSSGKPSPEGYLKAASVLGVEPSHCVVLEDAERGVAAGKAAGMRVIGIAHNPTQDLGAADIVVDRLAAARVHIV